MILFELSFPVLTSENKLYFNGEGAVYDNGSLFVKENTVCDLCTYFNSFSAGKYRKYTIAENISFLLEFNGNAEILIKRENGDIISSQAINSNKRTMCTINFSIIDANDGEIYYAEIHAKSNCTIFSGRYEADTEPKREIILGASFCTYKREKYIIPNMERLKKFRKEYLLPIKIFVVDNGSTLPKTLSDDDVYVIYNPNCGGSGGFARGLLEATDMGCTHIIFLDDDITLDTNVVLKTYSLLKILRNEYYESFIGGAMLLSEEQYMQHECGALWDGFVPTPLGHNVDMRKKENVIANDKLGRADYQAWWYFCFPTSFSSKFGYPLPFFIKVDDIEYSIRCRRPIINMNGIAVWHDSFQNKYTGYFEYYIKRNELITTALHCKQTGIFMNIRKLFSTLCKTTLFQRDFLSELCVQGYQDFLDGPEKMLAADPAKFNIELANSIKPETNPNIIGNAKIVENPKSVNKALYFLTLGGYILPSKNICIKLALSDSDIKKTFRARYIYHMNSDGSISYITRLKKRKAFWICFQTLRMFFKFIFNYKKIRNKYLEKQDELMSKNFWETYFSKYDKE